MANGLSKQALVKFIEDEITQVETALAFVVASLEDKTNTQFNYVYSRKKYEYEGSLSALHGVLTAAKGDENE